MISSKVSPSFTHCNAILFLFSFCASHFRDSQFDFDNTILWLNSCSRVFKNWPEKGNTAILVTHFDSGCKTKMIQTQLCLARSNALN